jgi:hypothetical protein
MTYKNVTFVLVFSNFKICWPILNIEFPNVLWHVLDAVPGIYKSFGSCVDVEVLVFTSVAVRIPSLFYFNCRNEFSFSPSLCLNTKMKNIPFKYTYIIISFYVCT